MDRRTFIIAAAAAVAACSRQSTTSQAPMREAPPLALQLYTVRDLMAADVAATLDLVAAAGYKQVEFAGYFDHSPAEMRALLDASGLSPVSAHVSKTEFAQDVARVIDHAAEMGHQYLVVPWLAENERSLDDYRRHAADFNSWAEACAQAGIQFAYHNHQFEFEQTDGQVHYDLLLAETDAELVKMQLDLCWAVAADASPVDYFEAWPGRFPLFHLKDFAAGTDANIGTGSVDVDTILARAETAGLQHGIVERDHPDDAAASIITNYDAILPIWNRHMTAS